MFKKEGQVWIETVIYTLIGLAIIAILLSVAKPAIDKKQDQFLIESSLNILREVEGKIDDVVFYGAGNTRTIKLGIKKGKLEIDSVNDKIVFTMDSKYKYSEPGQPVSSGKIEMLTTEKGKGNYDISLSLDYQGKLNLTWQGGEKLQTFQPAPSEYSISITNMGKPDIPDSLINVDFS